MKTFLAWVGSLSIIALMCFTFWGFKQDLNIQKLFPGERGYAVFPITTDLFPSIQFAGEEVPTHISDIQERMERELLVNTYWQSNGILLLSRMKRFFPIIEPILKRNNVPEDFKYLAVIESGLINVVSPSGATGFWQFLSGTGKDYGLEINEEVDERYHLKKSTEAACQYLKDNYETFQSWTLAAAAYNMGQNALRKSLEEQQVGSYYDLLLGEETRRYVLRIVALKLIHSNPEKFGFKVNGEALYPPYQTTLIPLDSSIEDFAVFANERNINYKILKLLNPWLRKPYLKNGSRKKYFLEIPAGTSSGLVPHKKEPIIFRD